jgi:hypothetical protein
MPSLRRSYAREPCACWRWQTRFPIMKWSYCCSNWPSNSAPGLLHWKRRAEPWPNSATTVSTTSTLRPPSRPPTAPAAIIRADRPSRIDRARVGSTQADNSQTRELEWPLQPKPLEVSLARGLRGMRRGRGRNGEALSPLAGQRNRPQRIRSRRSRPHAMLGHDSARLARDRPARESVTPRNGCRARRLGRIVKDRDV